MNPESVRLRWSDNARKAVEFEASPETLVQAAVDALIDARNRAARRYHAGQWKRDVVWYDRLEFHVFDSIGRVWLTLGEMIDTAFGPRTGWQPVGFFLPAFTAFPEGPPEGFRDRQESDVELVRANSSRIWSMIGDTLEWSEGLRGIARGLADREES